MSLVWRVTSPGGHVEKAEETPAGVGQATAGRNATASIRALSARQFSRLPLSAFRLRRHIICLAWLLCAVLGAVEAPSDEAVARAITRALVHLRGEQRSDGGIGDRQRTATTGLALIAHLAAGVTPDLPEHGPAVRRMITFLLTRADEKGYFGGDGGRMYAHGIACLALADSLGAGCDEDLEGRLRNALINGLAVTVAAARVGKAEGHRGGWRYQPDEATSDVSLTGWQLLGLHAARRIGLSVPDDVVDGARAYLRGRIGADGKVGYTNQGEDRPALRGLALLTLALEPGARDPLRDPVLARLLEEPPAWSGPWFFYRAYYDAVGLARSEPAAWPGHRARLYAVLVNQQAADGSWPAPPGDNERDNGAGYATAMAALALSVDRHLLPAHQP